METILKYGNRKLYSKTLKRYVTVQYVLDNVRTDSPFKVLRYQKGVAECSLEDVTTTVLAQAMPSLGLPKETIVGLIKGATC